MDAQPTTRAPHWMPPGFSLLEVIMVLTLLGIVGLMGTMGFIQFSKGFILARESTITAGKGQLAMMRLIKELQTVKSASVATATRLAYTSRRAGGDENHEFRLVGTELHLDGQPLIDQVGGFALTYHNTFNGPATAWSASTRVITLSLTLNSAGNIPVTFTTRAAPRNM